MIGVPTGRGLASRESSVPGRRVNETWCSRWAGARTSRTCSWLATGTGGDECPVLLGGLQAEVLEEPVGHVEVGHFQRVVVQARDHRTPSATVVDLPGQTA